MISGKFGSEDTYGAGIVFAFAGDRALVLTANHVVRSNDIQPQLASELRVQFYDKPSEYFSKVTLRYENKQTDLAVLEVNSISRLGPEAMAHLPFHLIKQIRALKRGDAVFPIGNPKKFGWGSPVQPDWFDRLDGDDLYFQSFYVQKGHSGGPVFDADWHVIGMVISSDQAPTIRALAIERILTQLRDWGLPFGVVQPKLSSGAIPPGETESDLAGEKGSPSPPGNNSWGGLSDFYRYKFCSLEVRQAEDVPIETNWLREAKYALEIRTAAGLTYQLGLDHLPASTGPLPTELLDGAALIIKRARMIFPDTNITQPDFLRINQALQGLQRLRLPLTTLGRAYVKAVPMQNELRLYIRLSYFDPEANSGACRDYETALPVPFGKVVRGGVSFNKAKATNHLVIEPSGNLCSGLLWLFMRSGTVWTSYTTSRDGRPLLTDRLQGDFFTASNDTKNFVGYRIVCSGPRNFLRIQAEGLDSAADYVIFLSSEKADSWAFDDLLREWTSRLLWGRGKPEEKELLGRVMEETVHATNVTIESEISVYESKLGEWSWIPECIIKKRREQFEGVLKNCCKDANRVRFVVELLRAEQGLSFDKSLVQWGQDAPFINVELKERAKKILQSIVEKREKTPPSHP